MTGFWKTDQIVTLSLFHFIGPANGHIHTLQIHSTITRLGGLVCFSRASFADSVNSWLRQWDPWGALHGRHGSEIHPSDDDVSYSIQARLGLWQALLGPIASPNSLNGRFNPPLASHPPTPYNAPSVILQWFWKKLVKIQQYKLANRNSYKTLAKRLFQLYSISGVATI